MERLRANQAEEAYRIYISELIGKALGVPEGSRYASFMHPELHKEIDVEETIEHVLSMASIGGEK